MSIFCKLRSVIFVCAICNSCCSFANAGESIFSIYLHEHRGRLIWFVMALPVDGGEAPVKPKAWAGGSTIPVVSEKGTRIVGNALSLKEAILAGIATPLYDIDSISSETINEDKSVLRMVVPRALLIDEGRGGGPKRENTSIVKFVDYLTEQLPKPFLGQFESEMIRGLRAQSERVIKEPNEENCSLYISRFLKDAVNLPIKRVNCELSTGFIVFEVNQFSDSQVYQAFEVFFGPFQ